MMLHIHLLGNPQIFADDETVPPPTPTKVLLLWAHLLLKRGRPTPRDHLAYTLWPDETEADARANLRRHLHLLRKQLPAHPQDRPWILATRQSIQWNPQAAYEFDVALVEEFDPATASEAEWAAMIKRYRGDLLEGFYDDWTQAERARLRRRYLRLLEQRIAAQKAAGDLRGAIHTTRRLLAHDPLREEPYRELMELYYRAGDRAAALREFEKCEELLRTELEAKPMPETLALRDVIMSGQDLPPLPHRGPAALATQRQPAPDLDAASTHAPALRPPPRRSLVKWMGAGGLILLLAALSIVGVFLWKRGREPATVSLSGPAVAEDTWLNHQAPDLTHDPGFSNEPYHAFPQVHLQYFNYPYDRVLVRFDLARLPVGASVEQAIFHIHLESFTNQDLPEPLPATVSAFRILHPWQADTATFISPWSQPGMAAGVDYDGRSLGSQPITNTAWVSIDVTATAKEWLARPDENYGLLLMITEAPQGAHYWVDTTDYPLSPRQPRLDVAYIP